MRRKDGQRKLKPAKSKPQFEFGFRDNPTTARLRHPNMHDQPVQGGISLVSLFAGCGGTDLGFMGGFSFLGKKYETLPFNVLTAIDNSEDAVETYRLNIAPHAECRDLTETSMTELPGAEVLLGGFPCQDFSSSGPKVGLSGRRGQLYRVMVDYMVTHRPKVVIGENVPHLARLAGGKYLETILEEFEGAGYRFQVWELYGPEYGLPQSRRRLFLVGVRDDLDGFPIRPRPTHLSGVVAIDDALRDLEEVADEAVPNQSQYFIATRATSGGGQGDHTNRRGTVAYCIRANARGRIQFHYELDRRLTVRECARLQSFPDEFVFPFTTQRNLSLIGNAVPPMLAHHVARSVSEYLSATQEASRDRAQTDRPRHRRPSQLVLIAS